MQPLYRDRTTCGEQHWFKFITVDATDLGGHQAGVATHGHAATVVVQIAVVECAGSTVTAARALRMDVVVAVGVA